MKNSFFITLRRDSFLSLQCRHFLTRTWAKNKFIGQLTRSSNLYWWFTMSHSKKPINTFPWTYKKKICLDGDQWLTQPCYWCIVSNLLQIIYLAFVWDPSHSSYMESQCYCNFINSTILSCLALQSKLIFFCYKVFVSTYIFFKLSWTPPVLI